ncbi:hypothetical protein RXV86_16705 [Alisedimentitalea sp. MJ-SS2]|uniref:hypothetical protein n=1 Tax=Aliisedimentitalea sp. MJ-SS2 TaxID=3049795 RepID=UPI00291549C0|nr:hypothetical protein [Alisedimentitalea sp. MJ-SS2]MDU8929036.1 hypothetical protein [Alisedimentitalea sp. MJ-SS2]
MMEKMGMCNWISWLIGLVAAIVVYMASVAAVTWIPALLIAIAVGCFLGLVLSHLFCGGGAADEAEVHGAATDATAARADDGAVEAEAQAKAAQEAMAAEEAKAAADAKAATEAQAAADAKATADAAAKDGGAKVKSTLLEGEEELAARKGTWKYEGGADAAKSGASQSTKDATSTPDYDGDGVLEGEDEGIKPAALDGPRDGQADNLKEIKGIGPKLEILCNELGFYHFDQIAGWTADEVAWVNANLKGFKGRVSRDNWVEQAKILAAGGETEFSERVDKGEVY